MSTVEFIRRLPSYNLMEHGTHTDPYVREIFDHILDSETLLALDDYTRGEYSSEFHYTSFLKFKRPIDEEVKIFDFCNSNTLLYRAFLQTKEILKPLQCGQHYRDFIPNIEFKASTSAGWGYIGTKKDNHKLAINNAYRAIKAYYYYRSEYRFVPYKAFARSQLSLRANPKIRHVWGAPFHTILIESSVIEPLLAKMKLTPSPIYIGRDMFTNMPHDISQMFVIPDTYIYCLDFSSFDAHVNTWFKLKMFEVIESIVTIVDEPAFSYGKDCFMKIPIVMPDGRLYYVSTGIPSGSMYTQVADSIVNLMYIYYIQLLIWGKTTTTYVLGDDSIFGMSGKPPSLGVLAKEFLKIGAVLNTEKSIITRDYSQVQFLGHNFYGSRLTRDEFTCAQLALYTERPVLTLTRSAIRINSLLYDSGFNSNLLNKTLQLHNSWYGTTYLQSERPISSSRPYSEIFKLL